MKTIKTLLFFITIMTLFSSCGGRKVTITLENPLPMERPDEAVVLTRSHLQSLLGNITEGKVPLLKDAAGKVVPSQADDLDKDGVWDELFFLVDLGPDEQKTLQVSFVAPAEMPAFTRRANIRFANYPEHKELDHARRLRSTDSPSTQHAFQMEGPAWENDKVGFRNYYDARNGIDIFGKRVSRMVLDSVGLIPHSYHVLKPWGMDILKVGNSLGAGAIALMVNDSVYRVDLPEEGTYERIADGPLRAIIRLGYKGWKAGGHVYDITDEIRIWGGTNFYQSRITVKGLAGGESLITGIVRHCDSLYIGEPNDKYVFFATHCNQAYEGEKLGMAILVKNEDFISTINAPEEGKGITHTYMVDLRLHKERPTSYCFYSGWEKQDPRFADAEFFKKVIRDDAQRMAHPVLIK